MSSRKWDDKSITDHILSREGRKPLNSSYYALTYPAVYAAAERMFGSWGSAIEACGLDYSSIRKYRIWSDAAVLVEIKKVYMEKQPLSSNHVQKNNKSLYMAAVKRFRSWGAAVGAVGIDYSGIRVRRRMCNANIKMEILALYRNGADLAYPNMKENYQYLLAAGMKKLGNGSWAKARKKCGIRDNYRMYVQRSEVKSQLKESA
ncbi:MAG TPA: hypothetical protein DET40_08540 [Lentisphaeria bacterium]|nr:MAG: hypothetical protein A2X45_12140 [Lentisphaerae bacterium GWF2_50_93]HCE43582.1 hypothetical protein [Lentisphaeria bacterium]